MKALSLWQPHAHLIGCGAKWYETRSWKTNYRGLLAIHASKINPHELDGLVENPDAEIPKFIEPYNHYLVADWNAYFGDLNHGGIEALVVLTNCFPAPVVHQELTKNASEPWPRQRECRHAAAFGDFSEGRWAWDLTLRLWVQGNRGGVVRGHQGLWTVPDDVERELLQGYHESTGGGMICRVCGCIDEDACQTPDGHCAWADYFLCTKCAKKEAQ